MEGYVARTDWPSWEEFLTNGDAGDSHWMARELPWCSDLQIDCRTMADAHGCRITTKREPLCDRLDTMGVKVWILERYDIEVTEEDILIPMWGVTEDSYRAAA